VGQEEGVGAAGSPGQVEGGIGDGGEEGAGDGAGQVDAGDPERTVHQLQRDAQHQLHHHVAANVNPAGVNQDVRRQSPNLISSFWVVDENGTVGYWTVGCHALIILLAQIDGVIQKHNQLDNTDNDDEIWDVKLMRMWEDLRCSAIVIVGLAHLKSSGWRWFSYDICFAFDPSWHQR